MPFPAIELRPASAGDAQDLSAIALAAKRHWGYAQELLEEWRAQLTLSPADIAARPTWVATIDGTPAGFYSIAPVEPCWTLEHLWVLPSAMGRGIGLRLLEHALNSALNAGAQGLDIDADPNAEGFYLRCGARRVGEIAAPVPGSPGRVRPQLRLAAMRAAGPGTPAA